MPVDERTNSGTVLNNAFPCLQESAANLFSYEEITRETAIARLAAMGAPAVAILSALVLRPLGFALDRWPEWPDMLPTNAIMGRCKIGRAAAMQALTAIGSPAIGELSRLLQSHDAELRQCAANALAHIDSPKAVDALRQLLYQERVQSRRRRLWWNVKRIIGGTTAAIVVWMLMRLLPHFSETQRLFCPLVGGMLIWVVMGFVEDNTVGLRLTAVDAISRARNKRCVGALASCLSDADVSVRKDARRALLHLLPQMRARDREYLSSEEMNILLRALDGDDPDLAIAILAAMQQIGDARVLRRVAFLIDSPVHYESVRNAAWECLPQVKLRLQEAQEAQGLLRPAQAETGVAADLLRPAYAVENAAWEDLLRPR
jgi:HEAT repeat protein